jgi:N-acetylmuramoyl-L-alanine amidase
MRIAMFRRAGAAAAGAASLLLASCSGADTTAAPQTAPPTAAPASGPRPSPAQSGATSTPGSTTKTTPARTSPTSPAPRTPRAGAGPAGLPLAGRTVGIDPGHNGGNFNDPAYISQLIWNGREMEHCNTTGTETDGGYTEAQFNFNVATDLAAELTAQGARVVMTRHSNTGVGPCVNVRAGIIDRSGASVAIDIHADGGPPGGRGVAILEPVADGPNDRVIASSERFGRDVLAQFEAVTGMPPSTYDGTGGIVFRDDLAGLNLTTVPEVLIESANMRNATDAAMLTSPAFQRLEAHALDRAIMQFLAATP